MNPKSGTHHPAVVKAKRFFTVEQDGLSQSWSARTLWLNPPYGSTGEGKSNQDSWTKRLIEEHRKGTVREAITLVNAATASNWWARLWSYPICFVAKRIRFETPEGKPGPSPTHSSVFVYMGPNPKQFAKLFSSFGRIVVPAELEGKFYLSVSLKGDS